MRTKARRDFWPPDNCCMIRFSDLSPKEQRIEIPLYFITLLFGWLSWLLWLAGSSSSREIRNDADPSGTNSSKMFMKSQFNYSGININNLLYLWDIFEVLGDCFESTLNGLVFSHVQGIDKVSNWVPAFIHLNLPFCEGLLLLRKAHVR